MDPRAVEFRDYLRTLRHSWLVLAVLFIAGLAAAACITVLQRPVYSATAKSFVSTQSAATAQDLSQGGVFTQQVVKSYAAVATTPIVLDPVIDQLQLKTSAAKLAESVSATVPVDEVVIEISVTNPSAANAASIADAVSSQLSKAVEALNPAASGQAAIKVTQIQRATVAIVPTSPVLWVNLAIGGVVGILMALVLTFARQVLDTRVRDTEDLRASTEAPLLAVVPLDPALRDGSFVIGNLPNGARAESLRSLRTNLQFLDLPRAGRVLVATSSIPSEGKSTTVANLGVTMADAGQRVLLIDADLRRPSIATYFGVEGSVGLTDVLIGDAGLSHALQEWGAGGLSLLPAGRIPPNPSELLQSAAMRDLLDSVREQYDVVLLDAPPLLPVTDAALLTKLADGAIVVAAVGRVHRAQLRNAFAALANVDGRVLGVVLNMASVASGYGYGYGYGGYYAVES